MKKVVVVLILAIFLLQAVAALESTKMYGLAKPNARVELIVSYARDGEKIEEQMVVKQTNNIGYWSLTMKTDSGRIELKVRQGIEEVDFEVPTGTEFSANLNPNDRDALDILDRSDTDIATTANTSQDTDTTTTTQTDTTTTDTAQITNIEVIETNTEETTPEPSSSITGNSIFSDLGSNNSGFIYIALILFIVVVIANLTSTGIIALSKKTGTAIKNRKENADKIRVTKLSERLNKLRQQEDQINKEIGQQSNQQEQQ